MVWADPSAPAAAHRHRQGDERTATWLELIFDLAFVLVVAELAVGLGDDLWGA